MGNTIETMATLATATAQLQRFAYRAGFCFRETGQALDAFGLRVTGSNVADYEFCRQRQMSNLYDRKPTTDETSFVHKTADIVGDVSIGAGASVWPGCVIRGDAAGVTVGANSNVQDDTVINTWGSAVGAGVSVGENVTIGHGTVIAGGCSVGDDSFIGMYSILGADVVILHPPIPATTVSMGEQSVILFAGAGV